MVSSATFNNISVISWQYFISYHIMSDRVLSNAASLHIDSFIIIIIIIIIIIFIIIFIIIIIFIFIIIVIIIIIIIIIII
jgi:hypothetical protein